jgi:hypothetical protein
MNITSDFFPFSIIASGSKVKSFNGMNRIPAPALFDALSYSQKVGKGIMTLFLTKV